MAEGFAQIYLYPGTYRLSIDAETSSEHAFYQVIDLWTNTILSQKDTLIQTNWMDTNYIYFLNSALPSPYDVDVANKDFGSYYSDIWDFEEYVEVIYGYGANYLVYQCAEELTEYFADKGFEVIVFGNYTLFCYR